VIRRDNRTGPEEKEPLASVLFALIPEWLFVVGEWLFFIGSGGFGLRSPENITNNQ